MCQHGAADVILQTQGQICDVCQHPSPQNSAFWHYDGQVVLVSGSIIDKQEFNTGQCHTQFYVQLPKRKKSGFLTNTWGKAINPAMRENQLYFRVTKINLVVCISTGNASILTCEIMTRGIFYLLDVGEAKIKRISACKTEYLFSATSIWKRHIRLKLIMFVKFPNNDGKESSVLYLLQMYEINTSLINPI